YAFFFSRVRRHTSLSCDWSSDVCSSDRLPALLAGAQPHVSTIFGPDGLLVLAAAVIRVDPAKVVNVVAPGGTGSAGGASVVFLSDSASALWEDLADGSLEPPDD